MRTRNILLIMVTLGLVALGATSCGLSVNLAQGGAAAYVDDLYGVHDMEALREAERLLAERAAAEKAESEKRIAAMIAASNAQADIDDILGDLDVVESPAGTVVATNDSGSGSVSIYNTIYVNDYASAYARRLQGFTSLTYRMPSSYWDYRYGDAYFLTLAYDPAFYTVMVVGDQVWVEPRYITNMFGSWNNPYYYGYRYGYNPYYYGYSYGYWDYWGWNSPYWGCDPYYHYYHHHHWYAPHYGHHHHPSYRPGGPGGPHGGGHREHNVVHRPSYGTTIGGSTSRPSYREQLGGGVRENSRGGTQIASGTKGGNTSTIRGGGSSARPSVTTGRPLGDLTSSGSRTPVSGGKITAPTKGELSGSLSGTTIKTNPTRTTRDSGVSGSSNSSSRTSRSATTTKSSSSSSSSRSSSSVSSSRSSSSVSSSRSSSSSSSRSSSSVSSSRSSSSSSSSSRGSYSSGSSRSSSGGGSNSSSRSSRR